MHEDKMSKPEAAASPPSQPPSQQAKRNSREERNFRSHYYEKVGFKGVDERKTVELLLAEDPMDREKLACFAVKCSVPAERRLVLWKVVLGAHALHPSNAAYVDRWRRKPYHDVLRALKVMRKVDDRWPKAQNLAVVYLLFTRRLQLDVEKQLKERRVQDFVAVAEASLTMCEDEVDAFWIAKELSELLGKWMGEEFVKELISLYHKLLAHLNSKLYTHLEKIGLNTDIPLSKWFGRAFAGVLHQSPLERVWDKVIGGSMVSLVYVAVALVNASKVSLLGCQTAKEALRCLTSTSEETDEMIVSKALEHWREDGAVLLPGDFFSFRQRTMTQTSSSSIAVNSGNNGNGNNNASLASSAPSEGGSSVMEQLKAEEIKINLD